MIATPSDHLRPQTQPPAQAFSFQQRIRLSRPGLHEQRPLRRLSRLRHSNANAPHHSQFGRTPTTLEDACERTHRRLVGQARVPSRSTRCVQNDCRYRALCSSRVQSLTINRALQRPLKPFSQAIPLHQRAQARGASRHRVMRAG